MEVNIINNMENKDGGQLVPVNLVEAPSVSPKRKDDVKKRRRGKYKRKIKRPINKMSWQQRRKHVNSKRRFRKVILSKTNAPYNNNQFLMEIHKPEPNNKFESLRTPPRTRDSSFSMDSEDNYFYPTLEDEDEYLKKEFSSIYEDAHTECLSNMSKTELVQEFLLLEAKYENLVKRTERSKQKGVELDKDTSVPDKDVSLICKGSILTDKDPSVTSNDTSITDCSIDDLIQRIREQEKQIQDLQTINEKLKIENESLRKREQSSSSEDSESDSSSTSVSCSSSNGSFSPKNTTNNLNIALANHQSPNQNVLTEAASSHPIINGFHNQNDTLQTSNSPDEPM